MEGRRPVTTLCDTKDQTNFSRHQVVLTRPTEIEVLSGFPSFPGYAAGLHKVQVQERCSEVVTNYFMLKNIPSTSCVCSACTID